MTDSCDHLTALVPVEAVTPDGCEECLATHDWWVHLRLCMTCGHVGCCDSSPNRHATRHARTRSHAVVQSYETGEDWAYCYPDDAWMEHVPAGIRRPAAPTGGASV